MPLQQSAPTTLLANRICQCIGTRIDISPVKVGVSSPISLSAIIASALSRNGCSRAWGSHASRVLSEPSRRGLQPTKFFPPNGENKEGDTSVWRDDKHHTPEACAPLFNCIVPAKSEYQKQVTDPTRDGLRMCVGEAAHLLRSSAACSPEIASSKTISVDPVCVSWVRRKIEKAAAALSCCDSPSLKRSFRASRIDQSIERNRNIRINWNVRAVDAAIGDIHPICIR
jgi:hypothetical protein